MRCASRSVQVQRANERPNPTRRTKLLLKIKEDPTHKTHLVDAQRAHQHMLTSPFWVWSQSGNRHQPIVSSWSSSLCSLVFSISNLKWNKKRIDCEPSKCCNYYLITDIVNIGFCFLFFFFGRVESSWIGCACSGVVDFRFTLLWIREWNLSFPFVEMVAEGDAYYVCL